MEIYYIVLYCVLCTTAASLSSVEPITESVNDGLLPHAQGQKCNCENGRCFTDNEGHTKCACKPGFSLQGEFTCKPCDCGPVGKCIFAIKLTDGGKNYLYQKKCVCNLGDAEKDGKCVDCFCGEFSACGFQDGERNCYCMEGYSEKNGVCAKCDCGFNGKCEYQKGDKKCKCDDGYLELNGTCEECYCGADSRKCSFNNNQKTCICLDGYVQKDGICQRTCKTDNECVNGVCHDGVCECLPGTWGDRCETVDCVTGAIKCNQMDLLWKGSDTLYVIRDQKLLKFVRRDLPLPYFDDCPHARPVKCRHRYDILWCGGNRIYVPLSRNKMMRYLIENSTGSRCNSSIQTNTTMSSK